jgi:uncharacterized membrane protein
MVFVVVSFLVAFPPITYIHSSSPFVDRWVDNIRMDLGEVGWGHVNWIGLVQARNRWTALVNSVLNLPVP